MNSFAGWIGGKKLLRKQIISMFPEYFDRYVEVFGGAGWVLFGKEQKPGQMEVFNDKDSNLINLFRCIKYHAEELQRQFEFVIHSREEFFYNKNAITLENTGGRGQTDIQKASAYLYLLKSSFSNDKRSFKTGMTDYKSLISYLKEVQERLNRVVVENKDFEDLIKVYDRAEALFYLDPPYVNTEKFYDMEFTKEDHERLLKALKSIKGKFILSYNNCDYIKDLYKDFNIIEVERNNNISDKKDSRFKEVIIKNY